MITVNITTTYQRLSLCRIALTSLLMQSHQPDKINVWVSHDSYLRDSGFENDNDIIELIESLPLTNKEKIKINWVPNTGPYRKLVPILRNSEAEDVIVTADDDIFYGQKWLEKLTKDFDENTDVVFACRVRKKKFNFLGLLTSYLLWGIVREPSLITDNYIVTFGGGAVLRRGMFACADISDNAYLNIAPTADDLWYSKLLALKGTSVRVVSDALSELHFIEHDDGLANQNLPSVKSFFLKVKMHTWDKALGWLGYDVCGNDRAHRRIEKHFKSKNS